MKIRIDGVDFTYPNSEIESLRDLDLSIEEGKNYAVMGKNGSGKTTLLKLLAGLQEPDSGNIMIGGKSKEVEVGFSPEDPELGFFEKTVKEEVEFYPKNLGLDHEKIALETLERIGISHLSERSPPILSSGQQRLVSIASVLTGQPEVLLLDEPTHSLHRHGEKKIGEIIDKIDKTIVFSTHSSDFAFEYADEVIVMFKGTVLEKGEVHKILSDEGVLEKAGIRPPGPVKWARENSIDIPSSVKDAVKMYREGKE